MVMLDEEGARVRHQTFTPFGRVHAEAGGSALRTFFAGHRRDEASGMFYMQARWTTRFWHLRGLLALRLVNNSG